MTFASDIFQREFLETFVLTLSACALITNNGTLAVGWLPVGRVAMSATLFHPELSYVDLKSISGL